MASPIGSANSQISSPVGLRWLDRHSADISKAIERLATGKRINRASDDPAGAIAAEKLGAEHAMLEKQLTAMELRSKRLSALDGGLSVVSDLLVELQFLVTKSANTGGLSESERKANQVEADSILKTLDHLQITTVFDGEQILAGVINNLGGVWTEEPPEPGEDGSTGPSGWKLLGIDAIRDGGKFNLINGDLEKAQEAVTGAIKAIAGRRAAAGAVMREIEVEQRAIGVQLENIAGARSAIMDTDYAREVGSLVRSQVLQQAAVFAVMTARKISAQNALALLG